MDYDLGDIDLEEKALQPLENPFGLKVLPMCPVRTNSKMAERVGFERLNTSAALQLTHPTLLRIPKLP